MSTTGETATTQDTQDTQAEAPATTDTTTNRRQGYGAGFLETISTGWAERPDIVPAERAEAPCAAARREAVSAAFPGRRLVVPAGEPKQRSNDTD